MKAIKFFVLAAMLSACGATVQAQSYGPPPGMVPGGGMPQGYPGGMPPAHPGAMPQGFQPASYEMAGDGAAAYGPGYCGDGACMNGYCGEGDCYGGDCYGGDCFGGHRHGGLLSGLFSHLNRPCLYSHAGRGYVSVDAVMLNRNRNFPLPLATLGAGGTVVLAGDSARFGFETLPRVTAGYVLPNDNAVEVTYFYKDDINAWASVGDLAGGLFIPDPTGTILNPFTNIQADYSTEIQNLEVNVVETGRWFNVLSGFRYLEIQDHMVLTGSTAPFVNPFQARIDTYNSLFGGQGGFRTCHDVGLVRLETQGKAGYFYNNSKSHVTIVNGTALPVTRNADADNDAFVGELSCKVSYRPSPSVCFHAGYQIMWIVNTALAQDQIVPTDPVGLTGLGVNDKGDLRLHGPSAGMEVRF